RHARAEPGQRVDSGAQVGRRDISVELFVGVLERFRDIGAGGEPEAKDEQKGREGDQPGCRAVRAGLKALPQRMHGCFPFIGKTRAKDALPVRLWRSSRNSQSLSKAVACGGREPFACTQMQIGKGWGLSILLHHNIMRRKNQARRIAWRAVGSAHRCRLRRESGRSPLEVAIASPLDAATGAM